MIFNSFSFNSGLTEYKIDTITANQKILNVWHAVFLDQWDFTEGGANLNHIETKLLTKCIICPSCGCLGHNLSFPSNKWNVWHFIVSCQDIELNQQNWIHTTFNVNTN